MKAVRLHGHKDLRIDELPEPQCGPGQVKLRPRFNGICGSDLHAYYVKDFAPVFLPIGPHPLTGEKPPIVFGHEFAGTVIEVGEGVASVQPGDDVTVMPIISEGRCDPCRQGAINCCRAIGFIGLHGLGGGMSDVTVVREDRVFKLPSNVDLELGALVEPLAVGWRAVRMVEDTLDPQSWTLVLGGGPVGCSVVLALLAHGINNIIVSEPSASRANVMKGLGVELVYDPRQASVLEHVMQLTSNTGADAVFDCAGRPETAWLACAAIRAQHQIVNLAMWPDGVTLDAAMMQRKEASWRATIAYTAKDYEEVLQALSSGRMNPRSIVTRRVPVDKIVEDAFEALHGGDLDQCKILIDMQKSQ